MDALLEYYKAKQSIITMQEEEYFDLMDKRSWCLLILALVIYALQVYAIHWVFKTEPTVRRVALEKLQYRVAATL